MRALNVGIPSQVFFMWNGGVDLITRLANAMALNDSLKIYVLVANSPDEVGIKLDRPHKTTESLWSHLKDMFIGYFPPKKIKEQVDPIKMGFSRDIKFVYYDNSVDGFMRCLKRQGIDVVMPTTMDLGRFFPVPWVGYIWDFQHRYYSRYFSPEELKRRDILFTNIQKEAPAIIVNSEDTKRDAKKFTGMSGKNIVVLPFSPEPNPEWFRVKTKALPKKYDLPKRYFIVSNQFWIHKDHLTAIRAIHELQKNINYRDIQLICTGKVHEPRKPEYIDQLKTEIKIRGLEKTVRFLGFIPKMDQIGLIQNAISVVQPTTFEGGRGGGSSNEAISMGTPLIVSDIPINKELTGPNIYFFRTGSSSDLAKKMEEILKSKIIRPTKKDLIRKGKVNKERLGNTLLDAVKLAVSNFNQQ